MRPARTALLALLPVALAACATTVAQLEADARDLFAAGQPLRCNAAAEQPAEQLTSRLETDGWAVTRAAEDRPDNELDVERFEPADKLRIVGVADQRLAQVHATTPDHPEHGTPVGALRDHPC